jgi:hypothetical protein
MTRVNRFLEDLLRQYVSPTQDDWDFYLPLVEIANNNVSQEYIQITPLMLIYMTYYFSRDIENI